MKKDSIPYDLSDKVCQLIRNRRGLNDALNSAISVHTKGTVRTIEWKSGGVQGSMPAFLAAGLEDKPAAREEVEGAPNVIAFMGRPPE